MLNEHYNFRNGYEGIVLDRCKRKYIAKPYIGTELIELGSFDNVYKAIEYIGHYRAVSFLGSDGLIICNRIINAQIFDNDLLPDNCVVNVRRNLLVVLTRMTQVYPDKLYFNDRYIVLSGKWKNKI